ncbi:MAG: hypothetical protein JEZ14_11950 [Marinilabiliaceae bacterium]|nr:hypothetical protein [Marinilabiliaceae bacterium]
MSDLSDAELYQIYSIAFKKLTRKKSMRKLYGDPLKTGATIEQAWRTSHLITGIWPVVLYANGTINDNIDSIDNLIRLSPLQLSNSLQKILKLSNQGFGTQIFYFDGYFGHSITLRDYDETSSCFLYSDVVEGDSLLCKENNYANIYAKYVSNDLWSIRKQDFEKIVCAAFVYKHLWALYLNDKYYKNLTDIRACSLFRDNLIAIDENEIIMHHQELDENERIVIGFDDCKRATNSMISINRFSLIKKPYITVDLICDFIKFFTIRDESKINEMLTIFYSLKFFKIPKGVLKKSNNSVSAEVAKVIFRQKEKCLLFLDYCSIEIRNLENEKILEIEISTHF